MSNKDVDLKCLRCKKYKLNDMNAYMARSNIDFNGHMHICKKCIKEIYNLYFNQTNDIRNAILKTCRKIDVAFYNGIVDMTLSQSQNTETHLFQIYMQKLNSLGSKMGYAGNCFDEGEYILTKDEMEDMDEDEYVAEARIIWGDSKSSTDYRYLDNRLQAYFGMMDEDIITESDMVLLRNICQEELTIRRKRENSESINTNLKNLQDLMQSANIRPTDIKSANASANADTFGKWIEEIEKNEPAEYFEDKKLFEDFDGIGAYLQKYILRPLKNLLTGTKDFNLDDE